MIKIGSSHVNEADRKNFYLLKHHQCLIAAWLVSRPEKCAYGQVDYGHGKSFVTLLAAEHLVKHGGHKEVYIVTLNDDLVKQTLKFLDPINLDT